MMPRPKKPDPLDQARRLREVRTMIKDSADAMPGLARELRRNAVETLDEIVAELAPPAKLLKEAMRRA